FPHWPLAKTPPPVELLELALLLELSLALLEELLDVDPPDPPDPPAPPVPTPEPPTPPCPPAPPVEAPPLPPLLEEAPPPEPLALEDVEPPPLPEVSSGEEAQAASEAMARRAKIRMGGRG